MLPENAYMLNYTDEQLRQIVAEPTLYDVSERLDADAELYRRDVNRDYWTLRAEIGPPKQ